MQYPLPLTLPPVFSAENFVVAACNREAWQWVNAWPEWSFSGVPAHALLLYGPHGSGKSHLGHVWAARTDAMLISATEMPTLDALYNPLSPCGRGLGRGGIFITDFIKDTPAPCPLPEGEGERKEEKNWLVEDIDRMRDERKLLHLLNYTSEKGGSLLLTSLVAPQSLPFTLRDLTSRLLALPCARIDQPDDEVLAGVMRKQFADRQIKVEDEVIAYILPRMERSLGKMQELVALLDREALAGQRTITIPFVKKVMEGLY